MTGVSTHHDTSDALDESRQAAVREFLERLCSQQYVICEWQASDPADPRPGQYQPTGRTIDSWVAQFLGVPPAAADLVEAK